MVYNRVLAAIGIGGRILGRSFMEAYRQAAASSQYQRAQARAGGGSAASSPAGAAGMTLEEACKILNVKPPTKEGAGLEEVHDHYRRLFDANDPTKGGSLYLQSKIVRARERIEAEAWPLQAQEELESEVKARWKPDIYKRR